jgi:hypothetical protein
MIEVVLDLDGAAEGEVVGADQIWSPMRDEQRAFGGPRANPFDLSQACNRIVVGQTTQLELGETTVSKAFRQFTHRTRFLARQPKLAEDLHVDGRELGSIWHTAPTKLSSGRMKIARR